MTGSDLDFRKVLSYREVSGQPLGGWPDKVEVFWSLPVSGWSNGVDRGVMGSDRAPWKRAKLQVCGPEGEDS